MTKITANMRQDMHSRRLAGESTDDIAKSYGLKSMTVYQHLCRHYGLDAYRQRPADNDNIPAGRIRRQSAHNGGCSTLSGMMPVTLKKVDTMETAPVARSAREVAMAANDNASQMQVAA